MTKSARAISLATAGLLILLSAAPAVSREPFHPGRSTAGNQLLETYFAALGQRGFSGAVIVQQHGKTLLRRAYGLADDSSRKPATLSTVFDLGSLTKQFTATAVLRLEASGRLKVTDRLSRFFPRAPADKKDITLHQLLTHTSGLSEHAEDDLEMIDRNEAVRRIFAERLLFVPGKGYQYSNSDYTLLAAIIEKASGKPYLRYLRNEILQPAGLHSTGYYAERIWNPAIVAHGYLDGKDSGPPSQWPGPSWTTLGNGEMLTTVDDMARWMSLLRSGAVLSRAQLARAWHPWTKENGPTFYGYGWSIGETPIGHVITHNGGGLGGNADAAYYPAKDLIIVILSNRIWSHSTAGRPAQPATSARVGLEKLLGSTTEGAPRGRQR
jgi:CubicO group peptidase (beta-lactamase class C family)